MVRLKKENYYGYLSGKKFSKVKKKISNNTGNEFAAIYLLQNLRFCSMKKDSLV